MGEKSRVNAALGILGLTGGLVIYSALDQKFKIPPELWGLATIAAAYFFSTAKNDNHKKGDSDD